MPSNVEITGGPGPLPPREAQAVFLRLGGAAMRRATTAVEGAYKLQVARSRRTGTWLRSITSKVDVEAHGSGVQIMGRVGTNLFYAYYVDMRGTGLYGPYNAWIVPKTARALRFPGGGSRSIGATGGSTFTPGRGFTLSGRQRSGRAGQGATYVYARRVRGIQPRRYARTTALIVGPQVEGIFHAAGREIAATLGQGRRR